MRQRAGDLEADLARTDTEIAWLANEIIVEEVRFSDLLQGQHHDTCCRPRLGDDDLAGRGCAGRPAPAQGARLQRRRDRPQSGRNRLQPSAASASSATFEPNDDGAPISGTVVNLTGAAGAPANLAINPDALSKEPYRVTVAPRDAASHACTVGHTGRVVFNRRGTAS